MHLRADFGSALAGHDLAALDRQAGAAYAVDAALTIAYVNDAWDRFADENGGDARRWGVGTRLLDAMSGAARPFYEQRLRAAMAAEQPWAFDYECSSRDRFRAYRMTAYPLPERAGLLVVNALSVVRAHDRRPHAPDDVAYRDEAGIVHQCSHCRRVRWRDDDGRWDWVPSLLERVDLRISHGFCPPCLDHYYPGAR